MSRIQQQLTDLLGPTINALGYELLGIEYISQGRHSLIRIFIDSENGIGLQDCEQVSRQVSGILDVEDPISGEYNLEVSSPGIDRPFFTAEQFAQFMKMPVKIRLARKVAGRRKLKGYIEGVDNNIIRITELNTDEQFTIDINDIEKANLIAEE